MEEAYQLDGELNIPEEKQTSKQTKKKEDILAGKCS